MAYENVRVPKKHDRVSAQGHNGVFAVVDVDKKSKSTDLQLVTGDGPVLRGVPWSTLRYMDEEDVNQAAARIVRETTEQG
jgi:hypothetical protein